MLKRKIDFVIFFVALVGALFLLNTVSLQFFGRLDLTRDKQFTLSDASKTLVRNLEEPVTVRAYFTKDLPPPYSTNTRYVKDLLDEYFAASLGNLRYEFIDPIGEETAEDKARKKDVKVDVFGRQVREATSIERELGELGIPPVQVRVNEDDKLEVKRAYMGIALLYGEESEVIPVVQDTSGLEYDLTTLLRKLTRERPPKIAFVSGHEGPSLNEKMSKVAGLLSQLFDVAEVDLTAEGGVPADVNGVMVVGPKTAFSAAEQQALDDYIVQGGSVAFLLDVIRPDMQTLEWEPTAHGLDAMLKTYGFDLGQGLVLDTKCATMQVAQQRGYMRVVQPVTYPFMPMATDLDTQHPLTRGLGEIALPFMGELSLNDSVAGLETEILIKTSAESWTQVSPFNLDPMQRWTQDMVGEQKSRALVASASGVFPSHFGQTGGEGAKGRVLVAAGSSFMGDDFLSPTNQAFVLNLMDWLVLDEALLAVRARGLSAAPLAEVSDPVRNSVKYGNIFGLPAMFALFGMVRWRMRNTRRRNIKL
ncbi:MAG: GldG family protein [Myxococcota bacterium]|jgi:gliding-associated putative ABC transporter substrate-binding component GldG|nr:GldG family protein [Myxococcota bacterium]